MSGEMVGHVHDGHVAKRAVEGSAAQTEKRFAVGCVYNAVVDRVSASFLGSFDP
jgi:hypothetical protein